MVSLEKKSSNNVSTGTLTKYSFDSTSLNLPTSFNLFVPGSASKSSPVPVLFYLAGLTCNEDTGAQKGGILNTAGKEGIAVVFPDTSPRGAGIEGEDEDWDFGTGECFNMSVLMVGAGFYLTATDPKWRKHYNMYDLVVKELPALLKEADLGLDISRMSIMGHSMGGTSTRKAGSDNRSRSSFIIPQEPRPVQVCIGFRTCLQPLYDPLGQESIW